MADAAKAICNGHDGMPVCRVRRQCLLWALDQGELFGVWGGLSEPERRRLKRGIIIAAQANQQNQAQRFA